MSLSTRVKMLLMGWSERRSESRLSEEEFFERAREQYRENVRLKQELALALKELEALREIAAAEEKA